MTTDLRLKDISPVSVRKQDGRGRHPNSLKNLKPYHKGHNGNPHPGYSLTARLKYSLEKPLHTPDLDAPVGEHIVYAAIQGALRCEAAPFHEVWDRNEGKLPEPQRALPEGYQDNRILNIVVLNAETKGLISQLAGWTQKPVVGTSNDS